MRTIGFVALVFCLLFGWTTSAQSQRKIDSLKLHLYTASTDSIKLSLYESLARAYRLQRTNTTFEVARLYLDSVEDIATKINNEKALAFAYFQRGVINKEQGHYYKALKYMKTFVAYRSEVNDSTNMSVGMYQIGFIQEKLGNYVQSLSAYQDVLNISNALKSDHVKAYVLHTIGGIQRKLNKHEQAIANYTEAISIWKLLNNNTGIFDCTESLGATYMELENFQKSKQLLQQALVIAKTEKEDVLLGSASETLGDLYDTMKQHEIALEYYKNALNIRKDLPSNEDLALSLNKVGQSLIKLGQNQEARQYLIKSLNLSNDMNINSLLMTNYKALTELYESENNLKEAYFFQKRYALIKDSIFNEEKLKQLNEIEAKYEAQQKDKAIALLTKETELKEKEVQRQATINNIIIGSGIFSTLLVGLLFYIFRQKVMNQRLLTLKNSQITEVNYKQQLSDLEMKALRAQMNPHFLFNCLNSINRMILSGNTKEASRYLTKFSRLIRKVLENSEKNMVSLSDELTMLKAYIQLEALRFKEKISYKTDIDKTINLDETYIPSMVLQPLIENAIWHGLMHKAIGGTIMLTIVKQDDILKCSVEDDGVGREANHVKSDSEFISQKSMGLHLTNKRLQIMSELGSERFIKIIDLKDDENHAIGTRVELLIPVAS